MTASLLQTKLHIPTPRAGQVRRPWLIDRLSRGLQLQHKLTLVSAPAGFGKTTLLSEWITSLHGGPAAPAVAWLSLDEDDNDLARFLAHLVAALQTATPDLGQGILEALPSRRPQSARDMLAMLVNQVSSRPGRFVLVLDDYHLIAAPALHDAVAFLLDHLPENLHLVIATRADPTLPVTRLRARGQVTELRQADLRFTLEETAAFLNETMALGLPAVEIAALAGRTEGWIAGLQMAAVSLQGREDASAFIQAFGGSDRHILDYLVEEVLQRQPEHILAFLLRTSILERLCGPLCDAVAGATVPEGGRPGREILEYLDRANLFVIPLDDRREWYRYHRLFADSLQKRLGQAPGEQLPALHRRASSWFEQNGFTPEAIGHALAARDYEAAARLIEEAAERTLMRSEFATFLGWTEALPDAFLQGRPLLNALCAGAELMSGQPREEIERHLQRAEQGDTGSHAAANVFRATMAAMQGDVRRSAELGEKALAFLPPEQLLLRSIAAENLGIVHMLNGDVEAAVQAFDQVAQASRQAGNVVVAAGAQCNTAGLLMVRGELRRAEMLYRQALELAADEEGRPLPIAGKALLGLGEISRKRNDLEAAVEYLTSGIERIEQFGEIGAVVGYLSLAHILQAQGDTAGVHTAMAQAQRLAQRSDTTTVDDDLVAAHQARLWVAEGNIAAAAPWAEEWSQKAGLPAASPDERPGALLGHLQHLTELLAVARVRLAQGRYDEALNALQPLLPITERIEWKNSAIELLAVSAVAFHFQGQAERALTCLEQALALGEPEGYVRVFLDEGRPMAQLLYEAAHRGIAPAYVGRLLAAFPSATFESDGDRENQRLRQQLVEPLTDREIQVLQRIAAGLSNAQIAQELVLTLGTVKVHTRNIYGRLGVNGRTQAVAKARALGILPET